MYNYLILYSFDFCANSVYCRYCYPKLLNIFFLLKILYSYKILKQMFVYIKYFVCFSLFKFFCFLCIFYSYIFLIFIVCVIYCCFIYFETFLTLHVTHFEPSMFMRYNQVYTSYSFFVFTFLVSFLSGSLLVFVNFFLI